MTGKEFNYFGVVQHKIQEKYFDFNASSYEDTTYYRLLKTANGRRRLINFFLELTPTDWKDLLN